MFLGKLQLTLLFCLILVLSNMVLLLCFGFWGFLKYFKYYFPLEESRYSKAKIRVTR